MKLNIPLFILVLLVIPFVANAQNSSHYCNIKLEYLSNRNGKLAFSTKENGLYQLCYLNFSTAEANQIFSSNNIAEYGSLSTDGEKIVFYSEQSGDREIYSIKIDGTDLKQLTNSPGIDEDPSWSPDGTKIVFSSERLAPKSQNIYIMNSDGSEPKAYTYSTKINSVPRWAPGENLILYTTSENWPGWDLNLVNIITREIKSLTKGIFTSCRGNWNSDGSQYVFSRGSGKQIDIYLANLKSGDQTQLTNLPGREYDAVFLDSKTIAFVHESAPGKDDFQIFELDIETKNYKKITAGNGSIRYLSWGK